MNLDDQIKSSTMDRRDVLKATALLMGGLTLSTGAVSVILNSCTGSAAEDWTPMFFTRDQIDLIAEVAERIIPQTETPGAKDAQVHRVIDEGIFSNYTDEQQEEFAEKLKVFDQFSEDQFGKQFSRCKDQEKDQVLQLLADEAMKMQKEKSPQIHIFADLRAFTIAAFLSSELAARELLVYDPIPGEYRGCIDFNEVGAIWAY